MNKAEKNLSIHVGGAKIGPLSIEDMERAAARLGKPGMKNTEGDTQVADSVFRVTADELRSFIERWERLDVERREAVDHQKEVMAEAKARGYDTKVMRRIIKLRAMDPAAVAEEDAVLELYKQALGMD